MMYLYICAVPSLQDESSAYLFAIKAYYTIYYEKIAGEQRRIQWTGWI